MFELLCNLAIICALIWGWATTAEVLCGAAIMAISLDARLDFLDHLRLGTVAQYTLVIIIFSGAGALLLGGIAGIWALVADIGARTVAHSIQGGSVAH